MPFMFDSTIVLLIPALILAFWAQWKVKRAYRKYSQVRSDSGLSGAEVARKILDMFGLNDVEVISTEGVLSDHYNPKTRQVCLSEPIYHTDSVAALGIAAHEVGHAIQHAKGYYFLQLRHTLLAPANLGSTLAFPLFLIGFFFSSFSWLMTLGIGLFGSVLAFQLVTLPVEFDASKRALANLRSTGILVDREVGQARAVLSAAALTYIAAVIVTLTHFLRLIILSFAQD
ncbi:MAG: zinc metallopeptidase [Calditrichaeota bacterium]|jgi:uncharacterized protein|nr:zinc metallopeptidase [Calditrichota bacterium]MBT7617458.1 zinc metallopeptidase [Calditrichota bacterium]MBT7787650.1 zinc metallopeptidase [Calditrichota bacterium]